VARVEADLGSGDEAAVVTFMQEEVERLSSLWPGSDRPCGKALTPTEPPSTRAAGTSNRQRQVFETA
jgi:hypothetical protein